MKSIILKPWELKAAIEGRLTCIVRPMKVQPPENWTPFHYGDIHKMVDGEFIQPLKIIGWGPCNEDGDYAVKSPFSPGETVFVKEAFQIFHPYCDYETGYVDDIKIPDKIPKDTGDGYWHIAYRIDDDCADSVDDRWCPYRSPITMPQWASRYHITIKEVEAKQAKDLTTDQIRSNRIKPDMVDSGGQKPDGSWIDVEDYWHPFLHVYDVDPDSWLWLYKVKVKCVSGKTWKEESLCVSH